jgi:hypothetical protein
MEAGAAVMVTVGADAPLVPEEEPQPLSRTGSTIAEPKSVRSRARLKRRETGTRGKVFSFLDSGIAP